MPVIVVGADTDIGARILDGLHDPEREIRVFVSDEAQGLEMRERGYKVALGDVSDESHVEAAATRCFSAVLITEAARDARERSFAADTAAVLRCWANAMRNSKVNRVIWVTDEDHPDTSVVEVATVRPDDPDIANAVKRLDDAQSIG
jgi:putative NADH-flavin reductase